AGKVRKVDTNFMQRMLTQHTILLLSPLGFSPTGEAFNLAMEDLATATATALNADKLIFLTPQPIKCDQDEVVNTELTRQEVDALIATKTLDQDSQEFLSRAALGVK